MANITIEIIETQKPNYSDNSQTEIENITKASKNEANKGMLAKSVFVNKAFDIAKQTITNAVEIKINRQVTLTEDYITGYQWQNVKNTIGMVGQIGGSIIGGITMGAAVGGPIGALVGGTLGLAGSVVNVGTNMYNKRSAIAQEINTANYNMAFQQTRMTLVNNSRGTEN